MGNRDGWSKKQLEDLKKDDLLEQQDKNQLVGGQAVNTDDGSCPLDIDAGIATVGGDRDIYLKILCQALKFYLMVKR